MSISGTYVVTGGGSGMGAGSARALTAAGAKVVIMDRDAAAGTRVADELGATALTVDVSQPDDVHRAFVEAGQINGLVHCAGNSAIVPLLASTLDEWHAITSVQLDGTFLCIQAAARSMVTNGIAGTIVTVSSVNASFVHRGLGAYCAAKAGITMLTKVAALEFAAAGIRVNSVAPGMVETGMTREAVKDPAAVALWSATATAGRIAQPDDIADVIVFLSSEASRWINGQTIALDSGMSLRVEPKIHPDEAWSAEALVAQVAGSREGMFSVDGS
jgi:3-oxoacyl-[acyl-carrier protein] reductase